jgi:hypothetical protein
MEPVWERFIRVMTAGRIRAAGHLVLACTLSLLSILEFFYKVVSGTFKGF